jgi:DNA polymerase elongation subunit (family B)
MYEDESKSASSVPSAYTDHDSQEPPSTRSPAHSPVRSLHDVLAPRVQESKKAAFTRKQKTKRSLRTASQIKLVAQVRISAGLPGSATDHRDAVYCTRPLTQHLLTNSNEYDPHFQLPITSIVPGCHLRYGAESAVAPAELVTSQPEDSTPDHIPCSPATKLRASHATLRIGQGTVVVQSNQALDLFVTDVSGIRMPIHPLIPTSQRTGKNTVVRIICDFQPDPTAPPVPVVLHVYNFQPYMYCGSSRLGAWLACYVKAGKSLREAEIVLQEMFEKLLAQGRQHDPYAVPPYVDRVQIVQRSTAVEYDLGIKTSFVKVWVAEPFLISKLRDAVLEDRGGLPPIRGVRSGDWRRTDNTAPMQVFECNVPLPMRFLVDKKARGYGWITLPADTYLITPSSARLTWAAMELCMDEKHVVAHPIEGAYETVVPQAVMSTDIECAGRDGHFPKAEDNHVIQICNVVHDGGSGKAHHQYAFSLGGALPEPEPVTPTLDQDPAMGSDQGSDPGLVRGANPPAPSSPPQPWGPSTTVYQYHLMRDTAQVRAECLARGCTGWPDLFKLVRSALTRDAARIGAMRMRRLLADTDAFLRTHMFDVDHAAHDEMAGHLKRTCIRETEFTNPSVPVATGKYRYGWLDVNPCMRSKSTPLLCKLVILSYFFPRLRYALSRNVYIQEDGWFVSSTHPERMSRHVLEGAFHPSTAPRKAAPSTEEEQLPDIQAYAWSAYTTPPQACWTAHRCQLPPVYNDFTAVRGMDAAIGSGLWTGPTMLLVVQVLTDLLDKEARMLGDFALFMRSQRIKVWTGYNLQRFDIPYLVNRAAVLGVRTFAYLSTVHDPVQVRHSIFQSKGQGVQRRVDIVIGGLVVVDVYSVVRTDHKLISYKLNFVANHFLGRQKDDVGYNDITPLWEKSDSGRGRVLLYCIKDALLPLELLQHLQVLFVKIELVRVTGVTMDLLFKRGQGILTYTKFLPESMNDGHICPYSPDDSRGTSIQYEGATVVEPIRDFYRDPITTLDYASLYPSIMMAHNLCYTTFIPPKKLHLIPERDREHSPFGGAGAWFVRKHVKVGILPRILEAILATRQKAKRAMRCAKTPFEEAVMNGRQLALKIVANSVYGFCGAYIMRKLEISAAVTYWGRVGITETTEFIEREFSRARGKTHDAKVIYGDTDSVMVRFGKGLSIEECNVLAQEAETRLNREVYTDPMKIEFEKVYRPYLTMNKKRYAGMLYKPGKSVPSYMDSKGLENVRRDTLPFTKVVLDELLRMLMTNSTVAECRSYVLEKGRQLKSGNVFLSDVVLSKGLSKLEYADPAPHVEVYMQRLLADADTAPQVGDRIQYVIKQFSKKHSASTQNAMDPVMFLQARETLDYEYYFHNCFVTPVARIFLYVLMDASLIHGATMTPKQHTKARDRALKSVTSQLFGTLAMTRPKRRGRTRMVPTGIHAAFTSLDMCVGCGKVPVGGGRRPSDQASAQTTQRMKSLSPAGTLQLDLDTEGLGALRNADGHVRPDRPGTALLGGSSTGEEPFELDVGCATVRCSSSSSSSSHSSSSSTSSTSSSSSSITSSVAHEHDLPQSASIASAKAFNTNQVCRPCRASMDEIVHRVSTKLQSSEQLVLDTRAQCIKCVGSTDRQRVEACVNDSCTTVTRRVEYNHGWEDAREMARRLCIPTNSLAW